MGKGGQGSMHRVQRHGAGGIALRAMPRHGTLTSACSPPAVRAGRPHSPGAWYKIVGPGVPPDAAAICVTS